MTGTVYAASNRYNIGCDYSEIRIMNNKKRRQKIVRRQYFTLFLIITIVLFSVLFLGSTIMSGATSDAYEPEFKYYKSVTVHSGDTIWDIAQEYYSEDNYSSFNSYLYEIISLNRLDSEGTLKAGENVIIPYYSKEYK